MRKELHNGVVVNLYKVPGDTPVMMYATESNSTKEPDSSTSDNSAVYSDSRKRRCRTSVSADEQGIIDQINEDIDSGEGSVDVPESKEINDSSAVQVQALDVF